MLRVELEDTKAKEMLESFLTFSDTFRARKGVILVDQGEVCKRLYYVKRGIVRSYTRNDKGEEETLMISMENTFITSVGSFFGRIPSYLSIEVCEDASLYAISHDQFHQAIESSPEIKDLALKYALRWTDMMGRHIIEIKGYTAKERYLNMIKKYPTILERVNLIHLASYLGITQQSLSRIRREVARDEDDFDFEMF